jgi:hypothetical protein
MNYTKILIIVLVFVLLYLLFFSEKFDIQSTFNLLTNNASIKDKTITLPIDYEEVNDDEVPNKVQFEKRATLTDLQKLKAINNILERIKEVNDYREFNPALQQITKFVPDENKLAYINQYIVDKLGYYSGKQYVFNVMSTSKANGHQTDDQYRIQYNLNGNVDDYTFSIKIIVIISKPDINNRNMDISFTELRVDNPDVYITPNKNSNLDNYATIN